jgi:hypothetical protein
MNLYFAFSALSLAKKKKVLPDPKKWFSHLGVPKVKLEVQMLESVLNWLVTTTQHWRRWFKSIPLVL